MHSFITTATMESLGLRAVDDWPQSISESAWTESDDKLRQRMDAILNEVVDKYTNIEFNVPYTATTDRASEYIKQLLTIGSVVMEFADAIREGDGMREKLCQGGYFVNSPISVPFVTRTGRAVDLQSFHKYLWINRLLKNGIDALASNKNEASILRFGKALGTIGPVLENYDAINGIKHHQTRHEASDMKKDILKVINDIQQLNLFQCVPNRKFSTFPNPKSLLHKTSVTNLIDWIETHID
uniref:Uncharacterized protein n=1 Tax=Amphimedon queenslandica TaxID=400682 RepID=A0A1X7TLS0_AMPQE